MRKILVYDHDFNIESISSCSKANRSIKIYSPNKNMSFNDNFDSVNPDCIWVNKYFTDVPQNATVKTIEYNIPYIIPNSFADIPGCSEDIISCVLFTNSQPILDKIYKYDDLYVRFYTLGDHAISHRQYCGKLEHCKDLTDVIVGSKKVIIDSDIAKNICLFYKKEYSMFKPKGTLSWISTPIVTISNMELFLSNENQ